MFDDNKIKSFTTLAETQSFTKTAKQLFLSQQAVSRNIAMLEQELDVKLFSRTTRSVELTPVGHLYYDLYSQIEKDYNEGIAKIKNFSNNTEKKLLTFGIISFMEVDIVNDAIELTKKSMPDIDFKIVSGPPSIMLEKFLDETIDLTLMLDRFLPNSYDFNKDELHASPLYLMISSDLVKKDNTTYKDYISLPYITEVYENEDLLNYRSRAKTDMNNWGLTSTDIVQAYDRDASLTYAELGYGIVIDSGFGHIAKNRNLQHFIIPATEPVWLLYRDEGKKNPAHELFRNNLQKKYLEIPKYEIEW